MKVLDVACGTADFTIEIAQKIAQGSDVTGVDISEGMMIKSWIEAMRLRTLYFKILF